LAGSERLRLFCALRLPDDTIGRLTAWQEAEVPGQQLSGARAVAPENLHITLAFLGSRPAGEVPAIAAALETAAGGGVEIRLRVRSYRETRSVGMLSFDDERGQAAELASRLHESLEALGVYRREARPWLPHVTVLRFRERPRLEPSLPALGEVCPSDAAVYSSVLQSGGAQYEALEEVRILDPFR
jgi:RNA 2',3'-cyclic 3'-phosphodiesterase